MSRPRRPILIALTALATALTVALPAAGVSAAQSPAAMSPVPPPPVNVYDAAGKVPTLDLWSPAGKPKELDKVKADKEYKSPGWSAAFSHPLGGTRNLERQADVEIKGRGNNTWCTVDNGRSGKFCNVKIPLQIKFADKVDLIGDNVKLKKNNPNANKTWVLMPSYADATLMRNKLGLDFARALGMPGTPEGRFVDLRMDGKYLGNYLLTEKVEVKSGRIDLQDPHGVIAELDNNYYYDEPFYLQSSTNMSFFVLKDAKSDDKCDPGLMWTDTTYKCVPGNSKVNSTTCNTKPALDPAYADQNAAEPDPAKKTYLPQNKNCLPQTTLTAWNQMKATINALDAELAKPSLNWAAITDLIDVDSFLRFYFVSDVVENPALVKSSIYFYKDGPGDKLHAGPAWDFDTTVFNSARGETQGSYPQADYAKNTYMLRLTPLNTDAGYPRPQNSWYYNLARNPQFAKLANDMWSGTGAYQGQPPVKDIADQIVGGINGYWDQVVGNDRTALGSALNNFTVYTKVLGSYESWLARNYASTYGGEVERLCANVAERVQFLKRDYGDIPLLRVRSHVAGKDTPWVTNGQVAGTVLENKQFETLNWDLNGVAGAPGWTGSGGISASATLLNGQVKTITDAKAGTLGTVGVGIKTFKMTLTGALAQKYDVQYRAYLSSGWQSWRDAGADAGSTSGHRLEAVQVRLLLKSSTVTPGPAACDNFKAEEAAVRAASPRQLFTDVPASSPFSREVNWLGGTGIATGTPITEANGNLMTEAFSPSVKVTREVMAAWIYRYANPENYTPPETAVFSDVQPGHPYYTEISWLHDSGLSTGYEDGTFGPTTNISRQALAAFLLRYAQSTGKAPADYAPAGPSPFVDLWPENPFYVHIRWLASSGITTGYDDGTFRPNDNTSREAMATFLYRYAGQFG